MNADNLKPLYDRRTPARRAARASHTYGSANAKKFVKGPKPAPLFTPADLDVLMASGVGNVPRRPLLPNANIDPRVLRGLPRLTPRRHGKYSRRG